MRLLTAEPGPFSGGSPWRRWEFAVEASAHDGVASAYGWTTAAQAMDRFDHPGLPLLQRENRTRLERTR